MKLFFVPNTRAHRPRWLLEELGVPFTLVKLDPSKGENKTPDYLALNPTGHVPTLVDDDGTVIFESAAICLYLADKFPEKGFAPKIGSPDRGRYLQWVVYSMSELEPQVAAVGYHTRIYAEEKRIPAAAELGRTKFVDCAKILTGALAGKQFLVGDRLTAADVMIGGVLGWAKMLGMLEPHPELMAYTKSLTDRPAFKAARAP